MSNRSEKIQRTVLPIPDRPHVGLTTYDARDPDTKYPPIEPLRPPENAPNVLIIRWPTGGGGFEYFYGFIGGETNQYYPALYEGTTPVEPAKTPEQGYQPGHGPRERASGQTARAAEAVVDRGGEVQCPAP